MDKYDFGGWATVNDLKCADGRTIRKDAFKDDDGQTVPLVWNHLHNDPNNVLGHALLKNCDNGVYAYCTFNDGESGKAAKELVRHGDVKSLSIYANKLKQVGGDVLHGTIRELSLVLAGANPGAFIDEILVHGEISNEEAIIGMGADNTDIRIEHSDKKNDGDRTIEDIIESMTKEQKDTLYYLVAKAAGVIEDEAEHSAIDKETGGKDLKHNIFDNTDRNSDMNAISHDEFQAVMSDIKRYGSLRDAFIAHGITEEQIIHAATTDYGITNIDYLFPDDRNISNVPTFISRDMGWVGDIMQNVHHTPFSRIKTIHADITEDEARAKGYIKGNLKKEEVFSLLKRSTEPQTVYKKQKFDRDDIVDITDIDIINFIKKEMRLMLDEELARAYLVGDGRSAASDDKIKETNIRPVYTDSELYSVKHEYAISASATEDQRAKTFIRNCIKARKKYKGSGNPTLYTTDDMLTDCLLIENSIGERMYKTVDELTTALRVKKIVTVPVMEGLSRTVESATLYLDGIIVNMADYNVGADKGGSINTFEDFDIDYNQQKYLMETRCSGALIKPYSALVIEHKETADAKSEQSAA